MKLCRKLGCIPVLCIVLICQSSVKTLEKQARKPALLEKRSNSRSNGWKRASRSWKRKQTQAYSRRPYWGYYRSPYYQDYGIYGGTNFGLNVYI